MKKISNRTIVNDLVIHYPDDKTDQKALIFLDNQGKEKYHFTYQKLKADCLRVAQNLVDQTSKGEIILLPIEEQENFVISFFGCLLAGCVPAPLPSFRHKRDKMSFGRVQNILESNRVGTLLISKNQEAMVKDHLVNEITVPVKVIVLENLNKEPAANTSLPTISDTDLAYIQYTSGSTASPKGVMLTHKQVMQNLAKMYRVFKREEEVRVVGWLPFHHDMGLVGHLFTVLFESGFGAFLPPTAFLSSPDLWLQAIHNYQGTAAAAPTFALEMCTGKVKVSEQWDLSNFKHLYVGSETVRRDVLDDFAKKFSSAGFEINSIRPVYGLAEATLLVAGGGLGVTNLEDNFQTKKIGKQIERCLTPYRIDNEIGQIYIQNASTGKLLPEGEEGEIYIKAVHNSGAYLEKWNNKSLEGEHVIHTGDRGFIQNGFLYLTGRSKEIIIIRGVNYNAEDLEHSAKFGIDLIQVSDQTVCVADLSSGKEELLIFQEIHRHITPGQYTTITDHIRANLVADFGVNPDAIFLIARGLMPKTQNYKVSRNKCLQLYQLEKLKILYSTKEQKNKEGVFPKNDPVVVVGMACRFPGGAENLDLFWEMLSKGEDGISEIPKDRWDNDIFYAPEAAVPGRMNTKWSGFTENIDQFDSGLFGISPYEAPELDPQQRMLLETSWRLLEHTGWKKEDLQNSDTGVFVGIANNDYLYMKIKLTANMEGFNAYSGLGNSNSVAANRLSYYYDLKGPSLAVDTACSSSLTAFHLAAKAILQGECKQAIAGGVNVIISPGTTITLSQFGMMSPEGRCKAFDSSADGYVRSEGCGLVMLKRKSEAIRDGDQILAEINASAIGQDGRSMGMTYPNGEAQKKLITKTLAEAGLKGQNISYVEAHGTGTPTGDPVEMEQLGKIYGSKITDADTCYVGSVKANIGHLETAAGIAGIIKVLLMLQHHEIPPQIHIKKINPQIHLENNRLEIPLKSQKWTSGKEKLRGAVSSFGFGGSLAHVIIEEHVNIEAPVTNTELSTGNLVYKPFPLSSHLQKGIIEQAIHWINWLDTNPEISINDLTYTQAMCRSHLKFRKCFLVQDKQNLKLELEKFVQTTDPASIPAAQQNKICFLFTGQGEQFMQMGRELYYTIPIFQASFDRCAKAIENESLPIPLHTIAFEEKKYEIWHDLYLQPILFAIQYSLGILYQECGVVPHVLLGHSLGEYAAACLAGCFEPETGMKILLKRAELVDSLTDKGRMVTIFTAHEEIEAVLDKKLAQIAVVNSPKKTVIAGCSKEVSRVVNHFADLGVEFYNLRMNMAFHCHLLDPVLESFGEYVDQFTFKPPTKRWISSTTAKEMNSAPNTDHWKRHMRNTVRFSEAVSLLEKEEIRHYAEIGPGASTLVAVRECLNQKDLVLLRSLNIPKGGRSETRYFYDSLSKLYQEGWDIFWQALLNGKKKPHSIPGLSFNRQSYWIKELKAENIAAFAGPVYNTDYVKAEVKPEIATQFNLHYDLDWVERGALPDPLTITELRKNTSWIILGRDTPVLQTLIHKIKERGHQSFWISTDTKSTHKPDVILPKKLETTTVFNILNKIVTSQSRANVEAWKVVYLTDDFSKINNKDLEVDDIHRTIQETLGIFIPYLKALKQVVITPPLWIVTQGTQQIKKEEGKRLNLSLAPLWGFAKTLFLEHPEWRGGMMDLDVNSSIEEKGNNILAKILEPNGEHCVAVRNGIQYIEQLAPVEKEVYEPVVFRGDGAFLITGGIGGLGLKSANWAVTKGAKHLILMSRRSLPANDKWASITEDHHQYALIQELLGIEKQGVIVEIATQDVRDIEKLEALLVSLKEREIPLRGVLHTAGENWFSKIVELDTNAFFETLKTKIHATWALHRLTESYDLDCFILFSSVSALWGSVNLSHYTAANYFMDMVSLYRAGNGQKTLCMDWGPWGDVGMSAKPEETELLSKMGFTLMPPSEALEAMEYDLNTGKALSLVGRIDWEKYRPFIDFTLQPSLFEQVISNGSTVSTVASSDHLDKILQASPDTARQLIEDVVRMELRSVMLIESMDHIPDDKRFNFLGMDSLMAILMATKLEQYFQVKLANTLAYNYPHIKAVSDYLFDIVYQPQSTYKESVDQNEESVKEGDTIKKEFSKGEWFTTIKSAEQNADITLYCFPYAGSGPLVFQPWASIAHPNLELIGVQSPGHDDRSTEKAHTSMELLVGDFIEAFEPPKGPYAFYGHSLGALTAYECYVALKKAGKRLPDHLFLSGSNAPSKTEGNHIHTLSDSEFVQAVMDKFENTKNQPERRSAIERTVNLLRADIELLETYQPSNEEVLASLTIIVGESDSLLLPDKVREWALLSRKDFKIVYMPGGHDLVKEQQEILYLMIEGHLNANWSNEIQLVLDELTNVE